MSETSLTAAQLTFGEGDTAVYTTTITDSEGTAIALANITTLQMTLFDYQTETIINSRDDQDVKNDNNCTYHATSGLFTWNIQTADNALVGTHRHGEKERHVCVINVVHASGEANHTLDLWVTAQSTVTTS